MKNDFLVVSGVLILVSLVIIFIPIGSDDPPIISASLLPSHSVEMNLPAVDSKGNGVIAKLKVQSIQGEGKTLTNINQLSLWIDTQDSIRTAKMVAQNITGKDLSKTDLVYNIETNAELIEGPSAGAALAIATVALMDGKELDPDVMITGTINEDGTIGPVGAVLEKAVASKDVGAKLFLVPMGEGYSTNYLPERKCEKFGSVTYCTTQYKHQRVDIAKDTGIEIIEVATVEEALKYFIY